MTSKNSTRKKSSRPHEGHPKPAPNRAFGSASPSKPPSKRASRAVREAAPKRPPKERYFQHPAFLKQWHEALMKNRWLHGGLLTLILVALAAGLIFLTLRLWEPPPLSKLLPDTTWRYTEGALNPDERPLVKGLGPKAGEAFFRDGKDDKDGPFPQVQFYTFTDKKNIENELVSGQALKYAKIIGRYFVIADSDESLAVLERVQSGNLPSLHNDPRFLRLRPHLPYRAEQFEYRRTTAVFQENETAWPLGVELGWLKTPLQQLVSVAYPVTGLVRTTQQDGSTLTEAYTLGDKTFTEGNALFHLEKKYKGEQLTWLPADVIEVFAGQELATTLTQFATLLDRIDGQSGILLTTFIQNQLNRFLPTMTWEELRPFFQGEATWATRNGGHIIVLEWNDTTRPILEEWIENLETNGFIEQDTSTGILRSISLTHTSHTYQGIAYDAWARPNGTLVFTRLIKEKTVILTTTKSEIEAIIDTFQTNAPAYTEGAEYAKVKLLLEGSDHVWLRAKKVIGVNLFDDGIQTLQWAMPSTP